jgi:hypothetical protein
MFFSDSLLCHKKFNNSPLIKTQTTRVRHFVDLLRMREETSFRGAAVDFDS